MFYSSLTLCCIIFIGEMNCFNMSQLLTSSYAQVSRSGTAIKTEENEGRSSGQTPWTHSSDVHVVRGQNLSRRKNQNPTNIKDKDNIGEVIQERFNPKPWFGYEPNNNNNNKGPTYIPPSSNTNNDKPQDLTVPFDSFPLSLKPNGPDDDNPPKNTYGSMYTSYDPPPALIQKNPNPNNFVTYEPPAKMIKPPKYLPPSPPEPEAEAKPESDSPPDDPPEHPSENIKYMPESADIDNGPPISQVYDHPYHHHHHHHHQDHHQYHQDSMKTDENPKFPGLPAYLDHDPNEGYNYYNYHHHHHPEEPPIYHEIKTTTEAAAEDQRLNKKPYSYYYLGRKLWYIPLYFSVYFIIYIFVLILKSIARHKITFNHYFEDDKREMKDVMTPVPHHVIHELGDHVWDDIHAARRKYTHIM